MKCSETRREAREETCMRWDGYDGEYYIMRHVWKY